MEDKRSLEPHKQMLLQLRAAAIAQAQAVLQAAGLLPIPNIIPPLPPVVPPPVAPLIPPLVPPPVVPPQVVPIQALVPPIPVDPQGVFLHVLEHVIGLDTQAKRDGVTVNAGCMTTDDLMYVETDSLMDCLNPTTTIVAKTRIKTLKKWVLRMPMTSMEWQILLTSQQMYVVKINEP
jgi:hypothetical protein